MKNKHIKSLITPITIIFVALILSGSYIAVQNLKQKSIERQQQVELQEGRRAEKVKTGQENAKQTATELKAEETKLKTEEQARTKANMLNACLSNADAESQRVNQELIDYGKTQDAKQYDLSGAFASVKTQLESNKNECYNKYPQY